MSDILVPPVLDKEPLWAVGHSGDGMTQRDGITCSILENTPLVVEEVVGHVHTSRQRTCPG